MKKNIIIYSLLFTPIAYAGLITPTLRVKPQPNDSIAAIMNANNKNVGYLYGLKSENIWSQDGREFGSANDQSFSEFLFQYGGSALKWEISFDKTSFKSVTLQSNATQSSLIDYDLSQL